MTIEEAQEACRNSVLPVRVCHYIEDEPGRYGYISEVGAAFKFDYGNRVIWVKFDDDLKKHGWSEAEAMPCAEKRLKFV